MLTLTLLTFFAGVLADYLIRGRKPKAVKVADETVLTPAAAPVHPEFSPAYDEGFLVPEGLRYHPGHTWVQREERNTARVGVDDFAAKLAGHIDTIELPKPGEWFRQGQPVFKIHRDNETTTLLCPIYGEVVEVNSQVVSDPSLLRSDPYGKGWLMTLRCAEIEDWHNLLPVNLVKSWMKEAVSRLYAEEPSLVGAVAVDRDRPMDDLLAAKPGADWSKITAEFFLP